MAMLIVFSTASLNIRTSFVIILCSVLLAYELLFEHLSYIAESIKTASMKRL